MQVAAHAEVARVDRPGPGADDVEDPPIVIRGVTVK